MIKQKILEKFEKKWCKTKGSGLLSPFCHIDDVWELLNQAEKEGISRIKKLIDKKRTKELGDNLEKLYGKRQCLICGTNPEKQRKMILQSLKE